MNSNDIFKIIIINDNRLITLHLKNLLSFLLERGNGNNKIILPGSKIDVATQGQQGLAIIDHNLKQGNHYMAAFVDIYMPPGWNGIRTIDHILKLDKNIHIVICTSYYDSTWCKTIANLLKTDTFFILKMPFDTEAVKQLICVLTINWQLTKQFRI